MPSWPAGAPPSLSTTRLARGGGKDVLPREDARFPADLFARGTAPRLLLCRRPAMASRSAAPKSEIDEQLAGAIALALGARRQSSPPLAVPDDVGPLHRGVLRFAVTTRSGVLPRSSNRWDPDGERSQGNVDAAGPASAARRFRVADGRPVFFTATWVFFRLWVRTALLMSKTPDRCQSNAGPAPKAASGDPWRDCPWATRTFQCRRDSTGRDRRAVRVMSVLSGDRRAQRDEVAEMPGDSDSHARSAVARRLRRAGREFSHDDPDVAGVCPDAWRPRT